VADAEVIYGGVNGRILKRAPKLKWVQIGARERKAWTRPL